MRRRRAPATAAGRARVNAAVANASGQLRRRASSIAASVISIDALELSGQAQRCRREPPSDPLRRRLLEQPALVPCSLGQLDHRARPARRRTTPGGRPARAAADLPCVRGEPGVFAASTWVERPRTRGLKRRDHRRAGHEPGLELIVELELVRVDGIGPAVRSSRARMRWRPARGAPERRAPRPRSSAELRPADGIVGQGDREGEMLGRGRAVRPLPRRCPARRGP